MPDATNGDPRSGAGRFPLLSSLDLPPDLRGLSEEDAVSLIVNGFCKEIFSELPMEFAVEAQKLLAVSLEGAVG